MAKTIAEIFLNRRKRQENINHRPNRFIYNSSKGLQILPKANVIELHSVPIISEQVHDFVRERIDFQLTNEQWLAIDKAMAKFWNNRVPGTWICNEDLACIIFMHCEYEKMLIEWERVLQITNQIWEFLILKGRLKDY